jgi:hypothetical protein
MDSNSMPWENLPPFPPFSSGQLITTALDGFISAAYLNLGEPLPDGRALEQSDPMEAWMSIMAASALFVDLNPFFGDEIRGVYGPALKHVLDLFTAQHADFPVPAPNSAMGAIGRSLEAALSGKAFGV